MKRYVLIIGVAVLALIGAGLLWRFSISTPSFNLSLTPTNTAGAQDESIEPYEVPPLGEAYTNSEYGFSLTLPEGFTARAMARNAAGSRAIVLEDDRGNGIQIMVTPFEEDIHALTAERIRRDVPDLAIENTQPVEIGANHTGLAFVSDNPAFGGSSREVWFVFRGDLYQVSTYLRLDELLQTMFQTWRFN